MLLLVYLITLLINVVPFFMPPTWVLLAYFRVHDDLPLLLLTVGGALCATAGRTLLALAARRFGLRFLPRRERANVAALRAFLVRKRWTYAGILVYAFGPIPSPHLFIAAGIVGLDLRLVGAAFFVGRVISYTALVAGAHAAANQLGPLFARQFGSAAILIGPVTMALFLVLLVKIDWLRLLARFLPPGALPGGEAATPGAGPGNDAGDAPSPG
jgi:membrane protein YqaA with SNARE-associated domain